MLLFCLLFLFSQRPDVLTTGAGVPVGDKLNSMTAGPRGPLLVQDVVFTDEMAHFDRERIPERVVHAKGAGMIFVLLFLSVLCLPSLIISIINVKNSCAA